jgi:hypothetical protein
MLYGKNNKDPLKLDKLGFVVSPLACYIVSVMKIPPFDIFLGLSTYLGTLPAKIMTTSAGRRFDCMNDEI